MKKLLVVVVVASDSEDVVELNVGNEHRADPVMDQSAGHLSRVLRRLRSDDDLSAADLGGAFGIFERPKEAAAGADPVLKVRIRRLQVIVPTGNRFGFQRRAVGCDGE